MLIDSDVLVWMTRGHAGAVQRLAQLLPWQLSAVTYIELAQGCRTKTELAQIKKGLAMSKADILPVTEVSGFLCKEAGDIHALS